MVTPPRSFGKYQSLSSDWRTVFRGPCADEYATRRPRSLKMAVYCYETDGAGEGQMGNVSSMTTSCWRLIQPARGRNEDLPGLQSDGHPLNVAGQRSVRQLLLAVQVGLFFSYMY